MRKGRCVGARKTDAASQIGTRVPGWARFTAATVGTSLTAAGTVAVFVTSNSTGAASLVVAGVVVGALGMFANRIQSLEAGEFKVVLATVAE